MQQQLISINDKYSPSAIYILNKALFEHALVQKGKLFEITISHLPELLQQSCSQLEQGDHRICQK